MAATPRLVVYYTAHGYNGGSKTVSCSFHFNGGMPADNAHFVTFSDAVVADLRSCMSVGEAVVETKCYPAGSNIAAFTKSYAGATGSISNAGKTQAPAFCCAVIRWATAARTSKNHPIYLFNYFHGVFMNGQLPPDNDVVESSQLSALQAFAQTWWNTGYSDGTNTYTRAGPNGASAVSRTVDSNITDHDLTPR